LFHSPDNILRIYGTDEMELDKQTNGNLDVTGYIKYEYMGHLKSNTSR